MPIAAVISKSVFCVHGGISPLLTSLNQIKTLKRPIISYDFTVLYDILWSDPSTDVLEYSQSTRGTGTVFGTVAVREFLARFNLRVVIRGHECVDDGIELFAGDSLYTVFSSSNYQDSSGNRCGLIYITPDVELQTFSLPPLVQVPRDAAALSVAESDVPDPKGGGLMAFTVRRAASDSRIKVLNSIVVPWRSRGDGRIVTPAFNPHKLPFQRARSRSVDPGTERPGLH
jgi:diadenosine tetraphosphatase ApaH/serine/threonine PP2A family protein phosphatase